MFSFFFPQVDHLLVDVVRISGRGDVFQEAGIQDRAALETHAGPIRAAERNIRGQLSFIHIQVE